MRSVFLHTDLLTELTHLPTFKTRYIMGKKFATLDTLKAYVAEPEEWKFNFTIRQGPKDGYVNEFWIGLTAQYKQPVYGIAGARYTKLKRLLIDERHHAGRWAPLSHHIEDDIQRVIGELCLDFLKDTAHANIGLLSERGRADFETLQPPEESEYDLDYEETDDYDWGEDES